MHLVRITLLAAMAAALLGNGCGAADGHTSRPAATSASALASATSIPSVAGDTALERVADRARVQGSDTAPLWVVEISDFQCPYCREWHAQSYAAIKKEYVDSGKIRLAYINFPLPMHRNAWPAAEAAMCAAAQNKFWPMHDSLFASQDRWAGAGNPQPILDSLALSVGVEQGPFTQCVTQHRMRALIQADIDRATQSGVNSTPTFIIGSTTIEGAKPTEVFRSAINAQLKKR